MNDKKNIDKQSEYTRAFKIADDITAVHTINIKNIIIIYYCYSV